MTQIETHEKSVGNTPELKKLSKPVPQEGATTRTPRVIVAHPFACKLAAAINELLLEPVAVLPTKEGDAIRPFQLGLGAELAKRRKLDVLRKTLNIAISRYTRSVFYRMACSQKGAMRLDIIGRPVSPVDESHQIFAREMLERRKTATKETETLSIPQEVKASGEVAESRGSSSA